MTTTLLNRTSFTNSVERHRRELHVHCYRMLGSFEESEDAVQETFLRAWRRRETFAARSSLRAWLYKIATNACLDALDKRPRSVSASGEALWLQPYPDGLLDELAGEEDDPEAAVVAKETVELAYLVSIQRLVPLQRAVLILRDVLGCSARRRPTCSRRACRPSTARSSAHAPRCTTTCPGSAPSGPPAPTRRRPSASCSTATCNTARTPTRSRSSGCSARTCASRCRRSRASGRAATRSCSPGSTAASAPSVRLDTVRATRPNRQLAVGAYIRRPGDDAYTPMALDVLGIAGGAVADIVTFDGSVFGWSGLPRSSSCSS